MMMTHHEISPRAGSISKMRLGPISDNTSHHNTPRRSLELDCVTSTLAHSVEIPVYLFL
jgi:hypothetical protein